MALLHFQHKSMGKSTHAKQAATSAVLYITRDGEAAQLSRDKDGTPILATGRDTQTGRETFAAVEGAVFYNARDSAASVILAGRMPAERNAACRFLEAAAREDRANARIADTFILALPRELSKEQRVELLHDWCETVTKGKAAYFTAIHDKGKDADNPHAHVIIRDRDYSRDVPERERGRVIGTTTNIEAIERAQRLGQEPPPRMTTWDLRVSWTEANNRAYERAGLDIRLDARSYKDQGIEREPGIHEGRGARKKAERGEAFESRDRTRGPPERGREVPYTVIDGGKTRLEENAARKQRNALAALSRTIDAAQAELGAPVPVRQAGHVLRDERGAKAEVAGEKAIAATQEARAGRSEPAASATYREQVLALRDAQKADRREMYGEQALDREALKQLHRTELGAFRGWAGKLIETARGHAFDACGQQFASRYEAARGIASREEREALIAAIRAEQSLAYKAIERQHLAQARAERARERALLQARQVSERRTLSGHHRDERRVLIGEQRADNKALADQWQAWREAGEKERERLANVRQGRHDVAAMTRADMPTQQREALRRFRQSMQRAQGIQPSAAIMDGARERKERMAEEAKRWHEERRKAPDIGARSREGAAKELTEREQRVLARMREKARRGDFESVRDAVKSSKDGSER